MAKMFSYMVVECIYGDVPQRNLFHIVEGYITCDGVRSRMTERSFSDRAQAIAECKRLEEGQAQ